MLEFLDIPRNSRNFKYVVEKCQDMLENLRRDFLEFLKEIEEFGQKLRTSGNFREFLQIWLMHGQSRRRLPGGPEA